MWDPWECMWIRPVAGPTPEPIWSQSPSVCLDYQSLYPSIMVADHANDARSAPTTSSEMSLD